MFGGRRILMSERTNSDLVIGLVVMIVWTSCAVGILGNLLYQCHFRGDFVPLLVIWSLIALFSCLCLSGVLVCGRELWRRKMQSSHPNIVNSQNEIAEKDKTE
jgi:hypothetical protein